MDSPPASVPHRGVPDKAAEKDSGDDRYPPRRDDLGKHMFHLICMDAEAREVTRCRRTWPQSFAFFRVL